MNKRGEQNTLDFTVSLILGVIVFLFLAGCAYKYFSTQSCPGGYDRIEDYSNQNIKTFCGSLDDMEKLNYWCCQRKTNAFEICKYDLSEKKLIDCQKIVSFNIQKVCTDNTECGVSLTSCSGAFCSGGKLCLVEGGNGKCADKFNVNQKEVALDTNLICGEIKGNTIGSKCEDGRHCVFDMTNTKGACLGGFFSVEINVAKQECSSYCETAKRLSKEELSNSEFCNSKFPILVVPGGEPIDYNCHSKSSPIRVDCSVSCEVSSPLL